MSSDENKEGKHTESDSIDPKLLAILDQLDKMRENLEDMHQVALGWKSVKMGETREKEKIETITTFLISQEEVHQ